MIPLATITAASATVARFGAVAALCWIGFELHQLGASAGFVDPSVERQAVALEEIAQGMKRAREAAILSDDRGDVLTALHEIRTAVDDASLAHR